MHDQYGSYRINPAFDRYPREAALVGKLLASFGEIEYAVCRNAGHASTIAGQVMKALYRLRGTSSRIAAADAFARPAFEKAGLGDAYTTTSRMVDWCLRTRNQFAHCNWADHYKAGLFFADLQEAADTTADWGISFRHVDPDLLMQHEAYFALTMQWLSFLDFELRRLRGEIRNPSWPKPPEREPPPLHNPPEKHVPPWLDASQKDLHIARALAAKGGAPTPTLGQQALDAARAEKRARKEADRKRAQEGRSSPDVTPPSD